MVKKHSKLDVKEIIDSVIKGKPVQEKENTLRNEKDIISTPEVNLSTIETKILEISAEIDLIQIQQIPEFKRLKLISSLIILQSRTQLALSSLNTPAREFNFGKSLTIKN